MLRGEINQGCSAGKNALLALVETAWVHFHDADDILAPEFVARAKARIGDARLDVLLFDYEQVDGVTGARMSRSDFGASSLLQDPVRYNLVNTVNNGGVYSVPFLRRVGGFDLDPAVRFNEDRAFHLRLAEAEARFGVEPYVGCQFQYFPGVPCPQPTARGAVGRTTRSQSASRGGIRAGTKRNSGKCPGECGRSHPAWNWQGVICVKVSLPASGRVPREGRTVQGLRPIHPLSWAPAFAEALTVLSSLDSAKGTQVAERSADEGRPGGHS